MDTFGERLKHEREKKGFNQKDFAEAIGVTPTRLNYWEKNKREPDFFNIRKIINILGCDADYLLGVSCEPESQNSVVDEIADKYSLLNDESKKIIGDLILQLLEMQGQNEKQ